MYNLHSLHRTYESELLGKPNVVGVAIGKKISNGITTEEDAIAVFVSEKKDLNTLSLSDRVPRNLQFGALAAPTDVVEIGEVIAFYDSKGKHRPPFPGISSGHFAITAGTLGCIAYDDCGAPVLVSNNHVYADVNKGEPGDQIYQPGVADGGSGKNTIATLLDFEPINLESNCNIASLLSVFLNLTATLLGSRTRMAAAQPADPNYIDAAIAKPNITVRPEIPNIGIPSSPMTATVGLDVHKSGRTTQYTEGAITYINGTIRVSYGNDGTAIFKKQIIAEGKNEKKFSAPGDSGSLILSGTHPVALLFAGSDSHTIGSPIQFVIDRFNITF